MKRFFLKLNDLYVKTFLQTKLFSQTVLFVITIILVLEAMGFVTAVYGVNSISDEMWNVIFQISVSYLVMIFLFGIRFLLLFSTNKSKFWVSQFLWIITYVILLSNIPSVGCLKDTFPLFSSNLSYIFIAYILISPLQQLGIIIASFIKTFSK